MAEEKKVIGDLVNDYETTNVETVQYHRIETSKGVENLLIFRVFRDDEIKCLRYDGREVIKVIYTNPDQVSIKQAFYRSTGVHVQGESYKNSGGNILTDRSWVPFDGVGYHDEGLIVSNKRDLNRNPWKDDYIKWSKRHTMLYKCNYFGSKLAEDFPDPVIPGETVSKSHLDNPEVNKNFELFRYGDLTTLRISFLLSSGDRELPPFWSSSLGQQIIQKYGFEVDPEHEISIESNYVDAKAREINNFVAEFVSFNWKDGLSYDPNYFKLRRKKRNYDLRYSYMSTAKGTWVMFDTYLHTNPDSRLPMESQSIESQRTKEIYDIFDALDIEEIKNKKQGFK
jgi:hypothetical protein